MATKFSETFSINLVDLGKAALMVGISALLTALISTISDGKIPTMQEFKSAGLIGLTTGIAYLLKNFLSGVPKVIEVDPDKTIVVNSETKNAIT